MQMKCWQIACIIFGLKVVLLGVVLYFFVFKDYKNCTISLLDESLRFAVYSQTILNSTVYCFTKSFSEACFGFNDSCSYYANLSVPILFSTNSSTTFCYSSELGLCRETTNYWTYVTVSGWIP